MTETKTIEIEVYRNYDGKPMCGVCPFLRFNSGVYSCERLNGAVIGNHGRYPLQNCPLWIGEI
jgi:hypothetical protein